MSRFKKYFKPYSEVVVHNPAPSMHWCTVSS